MQDFRDSPKIGAPALTVIALVVAATCVIGGYVAVGVWNQFQGKVDLNRISGFERPS